MTEGIRLQKFLSRAGVASRREAERLMAEGRVRVDGEVVRELGTRVVPGVAIVELDGKRIAAPAARWVALHKPAGVLTTRADPHGGRTVYDVLPRDLGSLRYVGRLDKETEGLLLLTNDGDVAHALQHPSGGLEREYSARVAGRVSQDAIARLLRGVELDDGPARAQRAVLIDAGPEESRLVVVLTEGRKREVRRMLRAVGHDVVALRRTRFGPIHLDDLAPGAWRDLTPAECAALERMCGAGARRSPSDPGALR